MKNLVLLTQRRQRLPLPSKEDSIVDLCQVSTVDATEPATALLTKSGTVNLTSNVGDVIWTTTVDDLCASKGGWFNVTFVDPDIVCLSRNGAIVTIDPSTGEANLEGEFDNGLEAGVWSPDGEILLLVTKTDDEEDHEKKTCVLLSMNTQFDVLAEVQIDQFMSSDNNNNDDDDVAVTACWQTDGSQCAVSSVNDGVRYVRIYDRETLQLKSVGRSEDGSGKMVPRLRPPLSWAGGGCSGLLASVQRKSKKTQQVVFFEPNGLRHRDFALRHPTLRVLGLCWNVASDLLAVALRKEEGHDDENACDRLQLWNRSNYHWSMKYEWKYPNQQIAQFKFHEEHSNRLWVALGPSWIEYQLQWDPSTVRLSSTAMDSTCLAVHVDGCNLNMTPFDKAVVPPPMFAATITTPEDIREIRFNRVDHSSNVVALLYLSNETFCLVTRDHSSRSGLIASFEYPDGLKSIAWADDGGIDVSTIGQYQICGESDELLEVVAVSCEAGNTLCDRLVVIQIDKTNALASVKQVLPLDGVVLRLVAWSDSADGVLVELDDASLLEYDTNEGLCPSQAEPLLEPCPWIEALRHPHMFTSGDDELPSSRRLVVGLSSRLRLYCHDRLLASTASSFILSTAHGMLCYALSGSQYQLRSLPLAELVTFDPLMGSDENFALEGYEVRNIERGSKLVAVVPSEPEAVLQMPRGNLEGIYPRALVLPHLMTQIVRREFGTAFVTMRRQKVDLNLIVDMDPRGFVSDGGAEKFVEQVKSIDHMNLFISCLQDFNITQFRHQIPQWLPVLRQNQKGPGDFDYTTKVNQVCQKVRGIMLEAERTGQTLGGRDVPKGHFLLPVLSTFAKENPPKLEEALGLIRERAFASVPPNNKKPPLFSEKSQSSIQYLAFLADYELLFKTALGMYDYDMARAVARNSQMDPKVYLPLLKRLRTLPGFYAKYEVDVRLQRYGLALENLHSSSTAEEDLVGVEAVEGQFAVGNTFDHAMELIQAHKLHESALQLYSRDKDKQGTILESLGQRLLQEKSYRVATTVFLSITPPNLQAAKDAARKARDWRSYFSLVDQSTNGDENVDIRNRQIAYDIAQELAAGADTQSLREAQASAARILLDYSNDVSGAVDMLVSAEMWAEAHRIGQLHSRPDLIKRCLDAAVGYAHSALSDFEDRASSFGESNRRYAEVIKLRKAAIRESGILPGEEAAEEEALETGSLFSVGSNASLRSDTSRTSVGSVASVSSVISASAKSTFTMTSELDRNKHKSKFNTMGKGQKKKKKKKKTGKKKMKPGSQEELQSLVSALKSSVVDAMYSSILADALFYLSNNGETELARTVFEGYLRLEEAVLNSQRERIAAVKIEEQSTEKPTGGDFLPENFKLPCESEVDALRCTPLPSDVHKLFSFFGSGSNNNNNKDSNGEFQ